jgi:hypothetical protein
MTHCGIQSVFFCLLFSFVSSVHAELTPYFEVREQVESYRNRLFGFADEPDDTFCIRPVSLG